MNKRVQLTTEITNKDIRDYYNYKVDSYEGKYNLGSITHLHTGIFDPDHDVSNKTLESLQSQLIDGQSRLTQLIVDQVPQHSKHILDLGAGHGGTVLTLASQRNAHIYAITISERQADIISRRSRALGLSDKITVWHGDMLSFPYETHRFDAIVGMESFCHIRDLSNLALTISKILVPTGILIISDYYSEKQKFINYFNQHWTCYLQSFEKLRMSLDKYNLRVDQVKDYTLDQAKFWQLSALHSSLKIAKVATDEEKERLKYSQKYHEFMFDSFMNHDGQYRVSRVIKKY